MCTIAGVDTSLAGAASAASLANALPSIADQPLSSVPVGISWPLM